MRIVYKVSNKLASLILHYPRKKHYERLRERLKNPNPTIIASDCFAGFVYHNLGLQFMSPTVNLMFSKADFFTFVQNLKGFLEADLVECENPTGSYPMGEMEYQGHKVKLHFLHYKNFGIAKEKWMSRRSRVNYSNLYIIQTIANATEQDMELFESLPYKNKMLITRENPDNRENVVVHPIFKKKGYRHGDLLRFKSLFSLERHMDDIDYVSFLNTPNK